MAGFSCSFRLAVVSGAAIAGAACAFAAMMTGPSSMAGAHSGASATALMSVTPAGHAVGVSLNPSLTVRFSRGMASGMEQFVDLHLGDPSGPIVPIHSSWSADRKVLTCFPDGPLHIHTQYALHIGGGLLDEDGHGIDMDEHGPGMGGERLFAGMMGGHDGMPWSMMGGDWHGANGSYGMFFTFTTE